MAELAVAKAASAIHHTANFNIAAQRIMLQTVV
jgi:hypothetical protein